MAAIKNRDTSPELTVRRIAHSLGFRYRLNDNSLPGHPDLVFPKLKKIIFVHGCFWHMHNCRYGRVKPATNTQFWHDKRQQNKQRDRRNITKLRKDSWQVLVVWECQLRKPDELIGRVLEFLAS